eukprot:1160511-Pelagomonas_calceolata.AAC.5
MDTHHRMVGTHTHTCLGDSTGMPNMASSSSEGCSGRGKGAGATCIGGEYASELVSSVLSQREAIGLPQESRGSWCRALLRNSTVCRKPQGVYGTWIPGNCKKLQGEILTFQNKRSDPEPAFSSAGVVHEASRQGEMLDGKHSAFLEKSGTEVACVESMHLSMASDTECFVGIKKLGASGN